MAATTLRFRISHIGALVEYWLRDFVQVALLLNVGSEHVVDAAPGLE
jgi:hypothetical protein